MEQTPRGTILTNLAVWFVLTVLVGLGSFLYALDATSLARHFNTAVGTIVAMYPHNHQSFDYTYRVGKMIHKGHGTLGGGIFNNMKLGDTIMIYYDTKRPSSSIVDSPRTQSAKAISVSIGACLGVPFIWMGLLHHFRMLPRWKLFTQGPKAKE
jgi:hypothetical protein